MTDSATLRRSAKYPREDKQATVKEIKELFVNSKASVFTEYRGLTVAQLKELRDSLRQADATYKVYKILLFELLQKKQGYHSTIL
jgi:large subunit ribosomal protein L10